MTIDDDACYQAIRARDGRFDGLFFTCVRTTGVYCRPVCTAKTPARSSCRFVASAALAEQAGFRPCLRCRPELAPGHAPVDSTRTHARAAAARIEAGALNEGGDIESLSKSLGISSRQLRRAVRGEFGVSPIELAQTCRLLLAKRLIADTRLPLVQVAFAAGFESVRRFNAAFRKHYRLTPTTMRRAAGSGDSEGGTLRLLLAYRPPFAWNALLRFLAARAISSIECVSDGAYHRTVAVGKHTGWLSVRQVLDKHQLAVEIAPSLAPVLPQVLARLRCLFDMDARPDAISSHLANDPRLAASVRREPGLRVPGCFDGFELAWRAVLGQQISVRGASTLAARLAERFGQPITTPLPCLNRLTPTPDPIAAARTSVIAGIGLPTARAKTLRELAKAVESGAVSFEPGVDPGATEKTLTQLSGIGPWTAAYIAMRALRWPDAFPAGDLGLVKASGLSKLELARAAEAWRPWRSYAAMHLWESLHQSTARSKSS